MKRQAIYLSLFAAALAAGDAAAQQTRLLTADKHNEYGLVYSLPVTALDIEVTATKEVRKAGPYFQYAKKYIGTDKVVKEDSELWTIESVRVVPKGVPDPDARYLMQLKPGSTTFIGVDEDGMLLSINREPEEEAPRIPANDYRQEERYGDREYLQYVDGDFIASQSTAKQAQMLAESLMEVREAKVSLTRGTAETMPTDGRQLEIMLNSLSHQEGAIMTAFAGNITHETVTRKFSFTPEDDVKTVLFRMSDFCGFVGSDDYSGDPVYITVNVTGRGSMPVDAKGEEKKFPKDGVAYCIPGSAEISLSLLGRTLFTGEFEFAQLGTVFGLNPSLFTDRKAPSYAVFDPATGGLKELGAASE